MPEMNLETVGWPVRDVCEVEAVGWPVRDVCVASVLGARGQLACQPIRQPPRNTPYNQFEAQQHACLYVIQILMQYMAVLTANTFLQTICSICL